ncbi:uncharacterized protein LOC121508325 [Cheilinus undulatus]|uniref:uncharacterized protein LOC121508325 n=1 Tax=Cheilinus undulatus TaxID=241271 RepID=UPI001BD6722D|nr:uncharacterized protein LOC121508325 [Cheilinus undulatus]
MAKGKVKTHSDSSAPVQPRSLRSRKRGCPSEEVSETDCVQDTGGTNTAVDSTLLQFPPQESTLVSSQQHQGAEELCPTKQDHVTEEKPMDQTDVTVRDFAEQEETTATNANRDSELESSTVQTDNDAGKREEDKTELSVEECNRSPTQKGNSQHLVSVHSSEDGKESFSTALEEQGCTKENFYCDLEKNKEASPEEPITAYTADVSIITKDAAAGLPAKKKRRMGMCGLTERERSHFLKTQKRESGQKEPERAETQIDNGTADLVAQKEIISSHLLMSSFSIPEDSVSEQNEKGLELQFGNYGGEKRAQAEVCITGTSPGHKQTVDPKLHLPAEEAEEEEHMSDGRDGSALVGRSPAIPSCSNPTGDKETEGLCECETTHLELNGETLRKEGKKDELTADGTQTSASSSNSQAGGFSHGSVRLCEAAVTSAGSEKNGNCHPDEEPGASPMNTEHPLSWKTFDPYGPGCLDYVSDSQLNTISLTGEEVMEREEDPAFQAPGCHEDASDLICGLIRELSSLNRKVMVAHRELENLRRGTKSSRSSTH